MSSQVATSLAPCLIKVFGPQEFLLVTLPGTAKYLAILFQGTPGRNPGAAILGCFNHKNPYREAADNAVPDGEILGGGKRAQRKFRNEGAPGIQDLVGQSAIFFRVNDIHAGTEYRDGFAVGRECAAMARTVDPPRQATDNA